jgi:hypothetical protein
VRYGFTREPTGSAYADLLEFCGSIATTAILVVRKAEWLDEDALAVMDRLRLFEVKAEARSEWPGTQLIGHTATVYRYRVDEAFIGALRACSNGLYEWQHPHRPEDLAFLNRDGRPVLTSIAHERDGYIELLAEELALLERHPRVLQICTLEAH